MHRGELEGRLNPEYYAPEVTKLKHLLTNVECVPLGALLEVCHRYPTFYGIEYKHLGVRVLKGENINEFGEISEVNEPSFIDEETNARFPLTNLLEGDLLMSVRGEVGKVGFVTNDFAGSNINANTIRLSLKDAFRHNQITPRYVWTFLNSPVGKKLIRRKIAGGVQETITVPDILEVLIPLPSLDIQRALVAEMEAARESRREKLSQADELLKSLDGWLLAQLGLEPPPTDSRQAFAVRLGDVRGRVDPYFYQPRFEKVMRALAACRFPLKTIGRICEPPVGGATPLRGDAELYAEDGVKFLRILNVKPNDIDLTDVKYIRDSVHNGELSRSQLAAADVLMTITGRVGTAAVVPKEILPANINQHIVRLSIVSNDCLPDYLAAYLNTSVGLAVSNRSVTGGTRIALDYQAIRSLPVPIPPKDIQQTIIEALNERRAEAYRLRAEAETEWHAAKERFEQQLVTGK